MSLKEKRSRTAMCIGLIAAMIAGDGLNVNKLVSNYFSFPDPKKQSVKEVYIPSDEKDCTPQHCYGILKNAAVDFYHSSEFGERSQELLIRAGEGIERAIDQVKEEDYVRSSN